MQAAGKIAALLGLATLAALGLAARPAAAQTFGYTIVSQGEERTTTNRPFADGTVGLIFTVGSHNVTVQSLGFFVGETGVLNDPHQIAIYTTDGVQIGGSATVVAGNAYTPETFTYAAPSGGSFTLLAGTQYVIGASLASNTDPFLDVNNGGVSPGTLVTPGMGIASIDGGQYSSGFSSSVIFPDVTYITPDHVYAGPDFILAPAPEPSQFAGLGLGVLGLGGLCLRARRRRAA